MLGYWRVRGPLPGGEARRTDIETRNSPEQRTREAGLQEGRREVPGVPQKGGQTLKKKVLALVSAMVLIVSVGVPATALAESNGYVDGTFTTGSNTPVVTVNLYDADGSDEITGSLTPQTTYTAKVNVTDADGLTNLASVTLKVWYDDNVTSWSGVENDEFNAYSSLAARTGIIYTWTASGGFTFNEESNSTWDNVSATAPTVLPGEFVFKFTVGKVANQTTAGNTWRVGVQVVDQDGPPAHTVYAYDSHALAMNSYREISLTPTTVDWGPLSAGALFGDATKKDVGSIKYISNGSFSVTVTTTSPWARTGGGVGATLDEDGADMAPNSFSLKASSDLTLGNAKFVKASATEAIVTGTNKGESGDSYTSNGLWIQLASTFAGGTYSGTITYSIQ